MCAEPHHELPSSTDTSQPIREIEMPNRALRTAAVAAASVLLSFAATSAFAQKKYDPGVTDTEIKIGNIMPYSGPASAYGVIGRTEAAYFKKINEAGGINGRKINFISYDDAYSPPKAVEQARKAVQAADDIGLVQLFARGEAEVSGNGNDDVAGAAALTRRFADRGDGCRAATVGVFEQGGFGQGHRRSASFSLSKSRCGDRAWSVVSSMLHSSLATPKDPAGVGTVSGGTRWLPRRQRA